MVSEDRSWLKRGCRKKIARKFGRLCQKIKTFDGQVFCKIYQGTAYLPGNEENDDKKDDNKEKN